MTITDDAIILSRESWRESDKRVCFYTRSHGKVHAVAVGAHKIRSKLSGHLEPLREVKVMFASGRRSFKIAQAVTNRSFLTTAIAIEQVRRMGTIVRFVERATEERERDTELFTLLQRSLASLSAAGGLRDVQIASGVALHTLAARLGIAPRLSQCVVCSRADELRFFSAEHGGMVCRTCRVEGSVLPIDRAPEALERYLIAHLQWLHMV
ncbi:MAG: DNA repair protein RecO [Candidatus Magasanikbacteria bacterium RIFCSPHIGHO2_01_FULL_50_8]|uniref:DNA repair protein RecO n=2 Tax=Candidatus Magasanikiibacteriota TaxID=1752731 RepID=A0A1F6LNG6_9BACT|nr:MAG: DNA repair protein RecO [Candidatus Magasanikbacteria bacterium RIFCSPHIGHO2_01_FULL_50_8]OGH67425.1 MAG: DNA repair protein RecO [Candidatus Magasanikbacteria bacterium RIFCSPHIGHO2_02_FULL_50_9b]